jgi:hypothetical protein
MLFDRIDRLLDRLGQRSGTGQLHVDRVAHHPAGELSDLPRDRRAEQQRLPLGGNLPDDPLDVRQEAHVEHPVGLVEHQVLHVVEVGVRTAQVIEQPARRRDHDVDPAAKRLLLWAHLDAAEDRSGSNRRISRQVLEVGGYLRRELTSRCDHECTRGAPRLVHELMKNRQQESGGLAASRLRAGEQVASGHGRRDRCCLDWRRLLEAECLDTPEQVRMKLN